MKADKERLVHNTTTPRTICCHPEVDVLQKVDSSERFASVESDEQAAGARQAHRAVECKGAEVRFI